MAGGDRIDVEVDFDAGRDADGVFVLGAPSSFVAMAGRLCRQDTDVSSGVGVVSGRWRLEHGCFDPIASKRRCYC